MGEFCRGVSRTSEYASQAVLGLPKPLYKRPAAGLRLRSHEQAPAGIYWQLEEGEGAMGSQIREAEDDGHGCASRPISVIVVPRSVQTWVGALTHHQRARYRPRHGSYTMPLTMVPLLQPSDRTTTISSSSSTRLSQVDLHH